MEEHCMDQLHHQKAKSGFEFPVAAFDSEEIIHRWQAGASKILHAQERIAHGMVAAMRAQMRFSQEFMVDHMNMMRWEMTDAAHLSEQTRKDIENFAALVKEVSGEIRSGFAEAGELLEVKAPPQKQHKAAAPPEMPQQAAAAESPAVEAVEEATKSAPAKAAPAGVKRTVRRVKKAG